MAGPGPSQTVLMTELGVDVSLDSTSDTVLSSRPGGRLATFSRAGDGVEGSGALVAPPVLPGPCLFLENPLIHPLTGLFTRHASKRMEQTKPPPLWKFPSCTPCLGPWVPPACAGPLGPAAHHGEPCAPWQRSRPFHPTSRWAPGCAVLSLPPC